MANLVRRASLTASFDAVLRDLAATWPPADIAYVRDEVEHHEYDDALENLVALGLDHGASFNPAQRRQVDILANSLGMKGSPVLARLDAHNAPAQRAG